MTTNDPLILDPKARMKAIMDSQLPEIVPSFPINRYFRSLNEMFRLAGVYVSEGNYESALTLYMRFCSMALVSMRKHPDYAHFESDEKTKVQKNTAKAVEYAEKLKPKVMARFESEAAVEEGKRLAAEQNQARLKAAEEEKRNSYQPPALPFPSSSTQNAIVRPHFDTVSVHYDDLSYPPTMAIPSAPPASTAMPTVPDRSLKPREHPAEYADGGLRPILLPTNLMEAFLDRARANTSRSIETCAILCGQMQNNNFRISHAIIPKQKGAPDSCDTLHEEEVFALQDANHLITLGWIHTHPTQTAFLSSVDLHCHCSYQLMLPEAIAIVAAPKFQQTGIFRLSSHGMTVVSSCRVTGFHPHESPESLFEKCSHVSFSDSYQVVVVDLRDVA